MTFFGEEPAAGRPPGEDRDSPRAILAAIALIVIAVAAAYANSLAGKFVLDDIPSIPGNPAIRHLWPLSDALTPPRGAGVTVEGRPVLNLSFAVNFALGGTSVRGYHLANLAIHILACLALFGIVRRTLAGLGDFPRGDALPVACACALIFGLHPLQTESVSYIAQRAESLMGLFFLVSLRKRLATRDPNNAEWQRDLFREL